MPINPIPGSPATDAGMVAYFSKPPAPIHRCRIVTVGNVVLIPTTDATATPYVVSILGKDTVQLERTVSKKTERIAVSIPTIVAVVFSGANELTVAVSA